MCRLAFNFVATALFASVCSASFVAPSTLRKFRSVLSRAKLQAPYSSPSVKDLDGFANSYFRLDGKFMQFQMNGAGRRSELRQMEDGTEVAWDVQDRHSIRAEILVPEPNAAFSEFTFLQIHCSAKPALRVVWHDVRDGQSDVIVAVLRTGEGDGDVEKTVLGPRPDGVTRFQVNVKRKSVTVKMKGGIQYERTLEYWAGFPCYFKAGVYIQHTTDSNAPAIVKFDKLWWK